MMHRVKGHDGLMKNTSNGAVINTDSAALRAFKARREAERAHNDRIEKLENKVDKLTELLEKLVNGKS